MEGLAVICIFVAATQNVFEGGAAVKPHFQNIGALGVVIGRCSKSFSAFGKCCANIFHTGAAPRFDAPDLHHVGCDI